MTDTNRMTAYLLGELSENECAAFEDEYFADDAKFEELTAAEADLVDAYVQGRLAPPARVRFEARYRRSARLRERVAFARQLANTAEERAAAPQTTRRRWEWIAVGGWWRSPAFAAGLAAAVLLLAAAIAWQWWPSGAKPEPAQARQDQPARDSGGAAGVPAPPPPASTNTPAIAPSPPRQTGTPDVFALVLAPGSFRSLEGGAELGMPPGAASVRVRVEHEGPPCAVYRVVVRTPEGRDAWSQAGLRPVQPDASAVAIDVPAGALAPGDYALTLSGGAAADAMQVVADYAFRVLRR